MYKNPETCKTRTVRFFVNHYICTGVEIKYNIIYQISFSLSTQVLMLSMSFLLLSVKNMLGYR